MIGSGSAVVVNDRLGLSSGGECLEQEEIHKSILQHSVKGGSRDDTSCPFRQKEIEEMSRKGS